MPRRYPLQLATKREKRPRRAALFLYTRTNRKEDKCFLLSINQYRAVLAILGPKIVKFVRGVKGAQKKNF